ncbi:uncharacterized protein RAG0_05492 [Rhynchosporium agropyri]|uniref:Pentatricopeptide repeat protein n=1 Tax=Rhynchosporium agropyri TaxID=914238 RepID=A0A1E1KDF6_9HELO|nr:uncharacterized protein RAG0_05492 [Rhynchosporium agropyri]
MPSRLNLLTERWSTLDLPILPFLAPRVFTPWPRRIRRSHSGPKATARAVSTQQSWDNKEENSRGDGIEKSSESAGGQNDFWSKYESIWGPTKRKKRGAPLGASANPGSRQEDAMTRSHAEVLECGTAFIRRMPATCRRSRQPREQSQSPESEGPKQAFDEKNEQKPPEEEWAAMSKAKRILHLKKLWKGLKRAKNRSKLQKQARGMLKTRIKFVRLAPEKGLGKFHFSTSWNWRFAMLNARYDEATNGRVRSKVATYKKPRISKNFIKELVEDQSLEHIRERWTKLPPSRRRYLWAEVMLTTLEDYPNQALDVLQATFMSPYPEGYTLSDSIDYIMSHADDERIPLKGDFLLGLSKTITLILKKGPKDHVHLSQRALFRLVRMVCSENHALEFRTGRSMSDYQKGSMIKSIYRTLVNVNHPMHANTLIQFASGAAKKTGTKLACEILQRLKDEGTDFNTPKILSLCSTLLSRIHQQSLRGLGDDTISTTNIFRFVLEAGAEPNIITYNMLLKSSLDVGDHQTAWQMHEMMIASGPIPDAHTYSMLLNDAKLRVDSPGIRAVLDHVRSGGIRNDHIATDILHAILSLHQQERRTAMTSDQPIKSQKPIFNRLLQVYYDQFDIRPLARIIPYFANQFPDLMEERGEDMQDLMREPSEATLVVMITGYLDNPQDSRTVGLFYKHFRSLLLQNDPVVAPLMKTTHVWNSVLMALGKFGRLADCSSLVGDMLSGPDHTFDQSRPAVSVESVETEPRVSGDNPRLSLSPDESNSEPLDGQCEPKTEIAPADDVLQPICQDSPQPETSPRSSLPALPNLPSSRPLILQPPKPDVYTWSILLKLFMEQRQPLAAEKVLTMMLSRGIVPTQVTYNTLIVGYARMDDTVMTVDALRRLEQAGFSADDSTMNALAALRNRRALVEAMTRRDLERMEGSAHGGVEERLVNEGVGRMKSGGGGEWEMLGDEERELQDLWRVDEEKEKKFLEDDVAEEYAVDER